MNAPKRTRTTAKTVRAGGTAAPAVASSVSEADFQRAVCDALTLFNWRWTHFRPANTGRGWRTPLSGSPGFFDIVAVRRGAVLFIELKGERGKVAPEQWDWHIEVNTDTDLHPTTQAYVFRPSDWDQVLEVLK